MLDGCRIERRHAAEDRGFFLRQDVSHGLWCRAAIKQHCGRADRHGKGHPVAQTIGKEELGRRVDDIVFGDLEHLRAIGVRRGLERAMDMFDALGLAGGAGRIEPEGDFVLMRVDRFRGAAAVEKGGEGVITDLNLVLLCTDQNIYRLRILSPFGSNAGFRVILPVNISPAISTSTFVSSSSQSG